ncbi:hypothetical protein JCM15519_09510 [Fundidesulfovibrio butyratiphilus]
MEALFRELVETNKEILQEIRQLREELATWRASGAAPIQPLPPIQPDSPVQEERPRVQSPWLEDHVRPEAPKAVASPPSASLPNPADFGLAETAKSAPPRYSAQDLEDLRGALLEGVKARNKQKRDAFAEFEKLHNR